MTLPIGFGSMPGGQMIGALFFIILLFAAFTSAIGMLEPVVAWLEEKFNAERKKMTLLAGISIWLVGLGSVLSFNLLSNFEPLSFIGIKTTFFGIVDSFVVNILVPINAFLITLFAGWVIKEAIVNQEFGESSTTWKVYWRIINKYVLPIALIIVFLDLITD